MRKHSIWFACTLFAALYVLPQSVTGQQIKLHTANFGGLYSSTVSAESPFADGNNFGLGAGATFELTENLQFGIEYNYLPYEFDDDTTTMEFGPDPWEWGFWERTVDAYYKDPIAQQWADIDLVTRMIEHSVHFSLNYEPVARGKIRPQIYAGIATHIFLRKFYYDVKWSQTFPASDDYPTDIQNKEWKLHGDKKKRGVAWTGFGGGALNFLIGEKTAVHIAARYHARVKDHKFHHWSGYYTLKAGFIFFY